LGPPGFEPGTKGL